MSDDKRTDDKRTSESTNEAGVDISLAPHRPEQGAESGADLRVEQTGSKSNTTARGGAMSRAPRGTTRENTSRTRRELSISDIMGDELATRASRANDLLKSKIKGTVLIKILGAKDFLFDGVKGEVSSPKNSDQASDSTIEIGEKDMVAIANGVLNPQLAMLSDKIKVSGNAELAIYFFNLISPN